MATKREWADAYLAQAHQDLIAARRLTGHAPSVLCMLLQMVFEKAAKTMPFWPLKPDDIAELALFLASPDSDRITGQIFSINGGLSFPG